MMDCDSKSQSSSAADCDRPAEEEDGTTAGRRTPVDTPPPEDNSDGAAAASAANDWCAWCGRGPSTDDDDDDDDDGELDPDEPWPPPPAEDDQQRDQRRRRRPAAAYDQLRFCSRSCLSRYKMDLFCRETQRYLHQLQGSDRLSSGVDSEHATKDQRILITPELWSQPETGDDHTLSVDPPPVWNDVDNSGTARRRRPNEDHKVTDADGAGAARQKVRKINASDGQAASRRPGRNYTGDAVQSSSYPTSSTRSRTPSRKEAMSAGRTVKPESGVIDPATGGGRPEALANLNLPWMPPSSTAVPNPLPSPFSRAGFLPGMWSHPPFGFPPPAQVRPPPPFVSAAAPAPLGFGAVGWPPHGGLFPPTAMFVPYPIPIPLPLPLPIPIPVPIGGKSADAAETAGEVRAGRETPREAKSREPGETDRSTAEKLDGDRPGDGRSTSASTTLKSIPASSSSSDTWSVLDLSTGGGGGGARSRSSGGDSSAATVWTDAVPTVAVSSTLDASPYLARRSLILDAPAVDRSCFVDHTVPAGSGGGGGGGSGGVRASSLTAAGKRFNHHHHHHRRRTTTMALVKSK